MFACSGPRTRRAIISMAASFSEIRLNLGAICHVQIQEGPPLPNALAITCFGARSGNWV